jgi:1-acyl-sn-glycerol-3-phosphate acyltransferase
MRTIVLAVFYVLLLIAVIPLLAFCALTGFRDPIIAYGRWAVRVGCRVLGIRVEITGLERVDPGKSYVFMANHLSFLDGPLMAMAIPKPVRIILKKSLFRIPVLGLGMRLVGYVPVDRKGVRGGKKSIERAARLMKEKGYSFLVFPEGTRSRNGRLQAFRRGGFFLALESAVPILPVRIEGSFEIMPRGQWHAGKGRVRVDFREEISSAGYARERMGELMEKVRAAIAADAR